MRMPGRGIPGHRQRRTDDGREGGREGGREDQRLSRRLRGCEVAGPAQASRASVRRCGQGFGCVECTNRSTRAGSAGARFRLPLGMIEHGCATEGGVTPPSFRSPSRAAGSWRITIQIRRGGRREDGGRRTEEGGRDLLLILPDHLEDAFPHLGIPNSAKVEQSS